MITTVQTAKTLHATVICHARISLKMRSVRPPKLEAWKSNAPPATIGLEFVLNTLQRTLTNAQATKSESYQVPLLSPKKIL